MKQFNVTGMSCAACSARVEKAVNKVEGVTACSVSLLTNSMGVEGTASEEAVIRAVTEAGYGASVKGAVQVQQAAQSEDALADKETPVLRKRLLTSLGFLLVLMYVSMGHGMWGWRMPSFFEGNYIAIGLLQMILAAIIMLINKKFFISGFKGLINRTPNMDTLVALGSGASFIYSVYALFAMTGVQTAGEMAHYAHEFYFESAAMILTLITVGKMLEARSKGKTTDALRSLMKLAPKTAVLLVDGIEQVVPVEQVKKGDVFAVRPGENIPVDGVILDGITAVDESALTGESIPADKQEGDLVSAGTINQSGYIRCEAARVGEDTTISQIIRMVSDAAATKAPIAKVADKVSGVFVPVVISIAVITTMIWLLSGQSIGFALARGISVLVISCPCALGLATPVAIMVGSGVGAKNGILFKTAVSLEQTGRTQIVALDKTGTITEGKPKVTGIVGSSVREEELLRLAASLESKSEHPLARAVMAYAETKNVELQEVSDFRVLPGNGLEGMLDGEKIIGGSVKYISSQISVSEEMKSVAERLSLQGRTPLLFAKGGRLLGLIAVADTIKEDSAEAIRQLQSMGIRVVMLTGDNTTTAHAIAAQAGVRDVVAGVLPDGKESVIRRLKAHGKVAMVGDGINDAPALTSADIGIAIGAGTDVAIDAADVVLMKSRLSDVPAAIRLSRAVLTNIHENLFWAFFYNVIGIPLAAGAFISLLGWQLSPMFGAAAMSLSSFCVVSNALRLNFMKPHSTKHDHKISQRKFRELIKQMPLDEDAEFKPDLEDTLRLKAVNLKVKEVDMLEGRAAQRKQRECHVVYVLQVDEMMCHHCEAAVKKALESVEGVLYAEAFHEKNRAYVMADGDVKLDALIKVLEYEEYPARYEAMLDELACIRTMKINGMMCEHCEAAVRDALESIDGVQYARVSHEKGEAVVMVLDHVSDEELTGAVNREDYEVLDIR